MTDDLEARVSDLERVVAQLAEVAIYRSTLELAMKLDPKAFPEIRRVRERVRLQTEEDHD